MGQKVHPHGLRVGVIKDWDSRWFADDSKFGDLLVEDDKIRKYLKKTLYNAGVPRIEIERAGGKVHIIVHCAKPGMVIGKGGTEIEKLRPEPGEDDCGKPWCSTRWRSRAPTSTRSSWPRTSPRSLKSAFRSAAP